MFMIFHVNFLFGYLNTYKRILKDYTKEKHVIFAAEIVVN